MAKTIFLTNLEQYITLITFLATLIFDFFSQKITYLPQFT